MSPADIDFYDFGPFRLDVRARSLRRGGQEIALTPKLFDLLAVLARNPGRTLAKADLLTEVWGETFVEEGSLAKNVSRLRLALSPEGAGEGLIATVARRGYRLDAAVVPGRYPAPPALPLDASILTPGPAVARSDSLPALPAGVAATGAASPRSDVHAWRLVGVAAVVVVTIGVGGWIWWAAAPRQSVRSLAVLPFRVLTPGAETEASFAVGLADAIITRLARADNLTVRPTSSILRYEQGEVDTVAAIRTLHVDALVEGTIRESSGRMRVSAQLIGGDGRPLGAWQFDEARTDLFALESAIATRVADVLALRVRTPGGVAAAPLNADAHEAYLRGRSLIARLTKDSLQRGITYLTRASELDPTNAPAFSALALAHINTVDLVATPSEAFPKARAAAERALALDPSLGEAHAMLGTIAMQFDWDWSGAERHFRRALDLDPNDVFARAYYGWLLALTGRLDESAVQVDAARAIDPLSIDVATTGGLIPYYGRRATAAQERMRQAVEIFPDFWLAHALLGRTLELGGDIAAAIVEYEAATHLEGGEPEALMDLGRAYARAGRTADARTVLSRFDDMARRRPVAPFQRAMVHVGLGEVNEAFRRLDEAIEQRSWYVSWLKMDPMLDPLRSDPRYNVLLDRAGLLQAARTAEAVR